MADKQSGFEFLACKTIISGCAILIIFSIMLCACNSGNSRSNGSNSKPSAISIEDIKSHYVTMAYAMYSDSLHTARELQTAVTAFLASPSETNLTAAKSAYKAARIPYQQSEILRWDTDITLGTSTRLEGIASVDDWEGQVNAWPLDESLIDYVDDGNGGQSAGYVIGTLTQPINTALLINSNGAAVNGLSGESAEANVATGFHAIEFLLWGQDSNGIAPGAGARPATDYDLTACTNNNCDRRRSYLQVVTDLLVSDLEAMVAEWSPAAAKTNGTLAYNYLQSDLALDYMLLAMRVMATDELASARMGSGLTLLDTEEEHDCFSDLSHVAIYYNFQGIKNAFYGTYRDLEGPSFSDLVKEADQATFDAIDMALMRIESNMLTIYELGEREINPIRFDQIIGEGLTSPTGENYQLANQTSLALINLESHFVTIQELLTLQTIFTGGSGDGD